MALGHLDEMLGEDMESGVHSVMFSPTFAVQQAAADPVVVGFLPGDTTTSVHVPPLHQCDLGERHVDGPGRLWSYDHPVERTLVGVETHEGGGAILVGGRLLIQQDRAVRGEVDLLQAEAWGGEDGTVVSGEADGEGVPDAVAQGDSDATEGRVEMEALVIDAEERTANIGQLGSESSTEALSVRPKQGQGDPGGGDGVSAGQSIAERPGAGGPGKGPSGGKARVGGFSEELVDEESVGDQGGMEGRRKLGIERDREGSEDGGHAVER